MRAIVTAYYYRTENSYSFGPFTEKQLKRFLNNDKDGHEKHTEWFITWFNRPDQYNTGYELSNW